ncbi:MAG: hypothetical protein R3D29_11360 [Nitratireductor sp.]
MSNPEVTLLANGMIAISVTETLPEPGDISDALTLLRVVNPANGQIVFDDANVTGANDWEIPTEDSTIATLLNGNIVVLHEASGVQVAGKCCSLSGSPPATMPPTLSMAILLLT